MSQVNPEDLKERANFIAEECGGIHSPFEAFYIHSIIYSAGCSKEAFLRYDVGLATERDAAFIVSAVHEALAHAAALSRFFWPSNIGGKGTPALRKLKERRAEKLRNAFNLIEKSALRDRKLRDALEHFDERLDRFLLYDSVGKFFPDPMLGDHTSADEPTGKIFKLVDPEASCFVLLGKKYFIKPVRKEVLRIFETAKAMDRNGSRLGR